MLQVIIQTEITDEENKGSRILEIREKYGMLDSFSEPVAEMNEKTRQIDLSCMEGHKGERIIVTHFIRQNGCTRLDYESERLLISADKNSITFTNV